MPSWKKTDTQCRSIGFLLFDQFSNHCLANALEPFRAANTLLGQRAYDWHILTPQDAPVRSSSGFPVIPTAQIGEGLNGEVLFVTSSYGYAGLARPEVRATLRRAAQQYGVLAGLDTGSWLLAHAGLLDGHRATIHYEVLDRFAETFLSVAAERARFVIDGDRISCGGAMAAFELVQHLIAQDHGTALTLEISQLFMQDHEPSPSSVQMTGDRLVDGILRAMGAAIEAPMTVSELAVLAGMPQRVIEQRFARALGATPQSVYRRLRLNAAKRLLEERALSIAEVALRCGYSDASAFARAFRQEFGTTPRAYAHKAAALRSL